MISRLLIFVSIALAGDLETLKHLLHFEKASPENQKRVSEIGQKMEEEYKIALKLYEEKSERFLFQRRKTIRFLKAARDLQFFFTATGQSEKAEPLEAQISKAQIWFDTRLTSALEYKSVVAGYLIGGVSYAHLNWGVSYSSIGLWILGLTATAFLINQIL